MVDQVRCIRYKFGVNHLSPLSKQAMWQSDIDPELNGKRNLFAIYEPISVLSLMYHV